MNVFQQLAYHLKVIKIPGDSSKSLKREKKKSLSVIHQMKPLRFPRINRPFKSQSFTFHPLSMRTKSNLYSLTVDYLTIFH
jgi:hypothetical protein